MIQATPQECRKCYVSKCRTETYKNNFNPSKIREWNTLSRNSKNIDYIIGKWRRISNSLYYEDSPINNNKHAQLRMTCNKLHADLFL